MKKSAEKSDLKSCWNRAADDELVFVLLARDPAAPTAIFAWINERIRIGKNKTGDKQIREAFGCAAKMILAQEDAKHSKRD